MLRYNGTPTGTFREADFGCWYTYRKTLNPWARSHGLGHEIDVGNEIRFGNVLRTVAHVCTNEDQYGAPIIERWRLRKNEPIGSRQE